MRPGYFDPGTAISFCAAACADGGCCAKAATPVTAQMAADTITHPRNCIA